MTIDHLNVDCEGQRGRTWPVLGCDDQVERDAGVGAKVRFPGMYNKSCKYLGEVSEFVFSHSHISVKS